MGSYWGDTMENIDKKIQIAISGFSGCGNTTVSNMLAERLRVPCINYTFRNLAAELSMDFKEIVEKSKIDFSFDRMVDTKQVELAEKGSCVLGSRLAIWLLPHPTLRVFLTAPVEVRVQRIANREHGKIEEILAFTQQRDSQDTERYKKLYGIDNTQYGFADLIIDTALYTPDKICDIIIAELQNKEILK